MIEKDSNKALLTVGNLALKNVDWKDYAYYCFSREKGLRKEALKHLDNFLTLTENWTIEQKIEFVKFLYLLFENVNQADYGLFPQLLSEKLIKPTLQKWCESEQHDSSPFRWYGKHYHSEEYLFKALDINSADDLARQTILNWWTHNTYHAVHHLPEYYIGDPFDTIQLGERIKEQIQLLTTLELRNYWTKELEEDVELVRNYIDWKTSGHADFEKWGKENNKRTGHGLITVYYNKQ